MSTLLVGNGLPADFRVPFAYFGLDKTGAGSPSTGDCCMLVYGQFNATGSTTGVAGSAEAGKAVQVFNNEDALFGTDSMLSDMIRIARKNNPGVGLWAVPLADVGAQAAWTVTFADVTDAQNQTVTLMVGCTPYSYTLVDGDTVADVAAAFAELIANNPASPVTAVAAAGVLTLTAKHAGEAAGLIDVRLTYRRLGYTLPAAVDATVAQTVVGAGVPDIAAALANTSCQVCKWIAFPYTDVASLKLIGNEFNGTSGRWNAMEMTYGHIISAINATPADAVALGTQLNDPHLTVANLYGSPTPAYNVAAALTSVAARHLCSAPELSRPLQTIALDCVCAPELEDACSDNSAILNQYYHNGIAGLTADRSGVVRINRLITTYQQNAWGADDDSCLDIQTLAQLQYIMTYLRQRLETVFPRHALKDDGNFIVPGSFTATPGILKAYMAAWAAELRDLNVIENVDEFVDQLSVRRSTLDPNAVDIIIKPDLVNQLRIVRVLVNFYLDSNDAQSSSNISGGVI